jgi:hypothetical protein
MLPLPPVWVALALAIAPVRAPVAVPADSLVDGAADALERGRPWQASRLIAAVLADSARRTPDALMLAATAASRWGGWPEVTRLLDGQPWVDSAYDARGRLLLARAALEQGADSAALGHALAVPSGNVAAVDGERLVLLATALDRLRARDSAAATYERAGRRAIPAGSTGGGHGHRRQPGGRGCTSGWPIPWRANGSPGARRPPTAAPAISRAPPRAPPRSAPAPQR